MLKRCALLVVPEGEPCNLVHGHAGAGASVFSASEQPPSSRLLRLAFEDNKRWQFESLTTPDSSLVSLVSYVSFCYLLEATDPQGRPTVLPFHKRNVYACVISD